MRSVIFLLLPLLILPLIGPASCAENEPVSGEIATLDKVWNYTRTGSEATFWKLAWSPDGSMVAAVFFDDTCIVLDGTTGEVVREIVIERPQTRCDGFAPEGKLPMRAVAFSPDGKYMALGGDDTDIHVFTVSDWKEVFTFTAHTGSILCLDFSPDSRYLASGSGTDKVIPQNAGENVTRIWDLETGEEILLLSGHKDGVLGVEWSHSGDRIATASDDRTLKVWSFPEGEELFESKGHTSGLLDVDWSPDDSMLITGSRDYKIKVWNSTTGETRATWTDRNCVRSVDIHPDGSVAATSGVDLTLKVRDMGTGTTLKEFKDGIEQHAMVMSSRWSPDGRYLASGLGKSHSLVMYSFGQSSGKGSGIDMMPITLGAMAVLFVIFVALLYKPVVKELRGRRP